LGHTDWWPSRKGAKPEANWKLAFLSELHSSLRISLPRELAHWAAFVVSFFPSFDFSPLQDKIKKRS
jgi:hypothetical protein